MSLDRTPYDHDDDPVDPIAAEPMTKADAAICLGLFTVSALVGWAVVVTVLTTINAGLDAARWMVGF